MSVAIMAGRLGDPGGGPPFNIWRELLRRMGYKMLEGFCIAIILVVAILILSQ